MSFKRIFPLVVLLLFVVVPLSEPVVVANHHHQQPLTLADCSASGGAGLLYMSAANDFGSTTFAVSDWFALEHDPTVAFQIIHDTAGVSGFYRTIEGAHLPTGDQWIVVGNRNKGYRIRNAATNCEIFVREIPFRMPVP